MVQECRDYQLSILFMRFEMIEAIEKEKEEEAFNSLYEIQWKLKLNSLTIKSSFNSLYEILKLQEIDEEAKRNFQFSL